MVELAEREVAEHQALGQRAAAVCDEVILVGPERTPADRAGPRRGRLLGRTSTSSRDRAEATAASGDCSGRRRGALGERPAGHLRRANGGIAARPSAEERRPTPSTRRGVASSRPLAASPEDSRPSWWTLRIVYRESGRPDAPPVVVLHGWGASSAAVASIQACLRDTHRTFAPDLPGFGASDPPPDVWGTAEYARAVRGLHGRARLGRASFIGHSRGGHIAVVIAATTPGRVDRRCWSTAPASAPRAARATERASLAFKAGGAPRRPAAGGPLGQPLRGWFGQRFGSADYRQAGAMRGTLVRAGQRGRPPPAPEGRRRRRC